MSEDEDYSDIDNIEQKAEDQIDNDEIDGAEEGFLKGYEAADDYNETEEDQFEKDDEIQK